MVTLWQASDKGHLCTSRSSWKTCDPSWPVLSFLGLFWFTPLQDRSGSSVVNVLIHIIVKGPRQRRLYSVSGILELKKVSYLTDGTQRLRRHLYNKKSCHHEGQYVDIYSCTKHDFYGKILGLKPLTLKLQIDPIFPIFHSYYLSVRWSQQQESMSSYRYVI